MNCRDYAKCRVRSNERDFPYKASNGSISAMSSSRSKFLTFWTFEITPSVRHDYLFSLAAILLPVAAVARRLDRDLGPGQGGLGPKN